MKAVWYEQYGEARDVLHYGEMEDPVPRQDEVMVRVRVSGLNPSDVKRRRGTSVSNPRLPRVIPHMDGSGVVESVGSNVRNLKVGDRVWIYEAQLGRPYGTAAELAVIPEYRAVKLPETIDFDIGASLGIPAMTAHRCLFSDGPIEGKIVLVQGGAGAVGNYAVQLAKWGKAKRVIATASSDEKSLVAKQAGADYVLNYKTDDIVEKMKQIATEGIDRIVEVSFGANWETDATLLKPSGVISTYASDSDREPKIQFYALMRKDLTVHFVLVYAMPMEAHKDAIRDIREALRMGFLKPKVASRFPLSRTADAHEMLESGKAVGKILIDIA
ncbi:MAG: NADPH:quinone reductase [Nitrososphaerota archaeon]|nr:NADPH:quinone reductase [Nitrososphaerota archaeon]